MSREERPRTSSTSAAGRSTEAPLGGEQRCQGGGLVDVHGDRRFARGEQLVGGHVGHEAATADDDEVVGDLGHLGHQVGGDEDGAALVGQEAQQVADPHHAVGVEPVDRFVQHHDRRVAQQGQGDAESLTHPERVAGDPLVRHVDQADLGEHLVDPACGRGRWWRLPR